MHSQQHTFVERGAEDDNGRGPWIAHDSCSLERRQRHRRPRADDESDGAWHKFPRSLPAPRDDLQPGMRVVRGRDWKWGDQDGPGGEGTVLEMLRGGAVRVCWDHSAQINTYRVGCEDEKFDVRRSPRSESLPPGLALGDKHRNKGLCVQSRFGWCAFSSAALI